MPDELVIQEAARWLLWSLATRAVRLKLRNKTPTQLWHRLVMSFEWSSRTFGNTGFLAKR